MATNVIEIEGLRKDYRGLRTTIAAIDGLDLGTFRQRDVTATT